MSPGFAELDRALLGRLMLGTAAVRELSERPRLRTRIKPLQSFYDSRNTVALRRLFAEDFLGRFCARLEVARTRGATGQTREAGVAYQGLLVASQVFQLNVALLQTLLASAAAIEMAAVMAEAAAASMGPPSAVGALAGSGGAAQLVLNRAMVIEVAGALETLIAGGAVDGAIVTGLYAMAIETGAPPGISRALAKWLEKNPNASASDRSAAQSVLDDLRDALGDNP